MNKVEVAGYIKDLKLKVGSSSDLVTEVKLHVQGEVGELLSLMKVPVKISFEVLEETFGHKVE